MNSNLTRFPRPVLIVDGALDVLDYSRRSLALFGQSDHGADDGADSREQLGAALANDTELGDNLALATARLLRPGDEESFVWAHGGRSYEVTISAVEGDDGAFAVVFDDTTDRRMTEDIHVNARDYLEQILGDIPIGVAVLNDELRITSVNRQMLEFVHRMGVAASLVDVVGSTPGDLLPEDPGRRWQEMCEEVLKSGRRSAEDKHALGLDDEVLVLVSAVTPLRDRGGDASGVILMSTDVTERTRLERELVKMEKLATVGQMVVTVNHEINNPLSIISTNAQSARLLNKDLDEKTKSKLKTIEEQVKRISAVTERLRTMDEVASSEYIAEGPQMIDLGDLSGTDHDEREQA